MIYYIQIDENKKVTGYSSSRNSEVDLEFNLEDLTEEFLNMPWFFVYEESTNQLIYKEEIQKEEQEKREKRLTNEQKLGQKCSDLEIQLMMMQQLIMQKKEEVK
ncbi:hypothetical protein UT300003_33170 [Clostridium sardiniense]